MLKIYAIPALSSLALVTASACGPSNSPGDCLQGTLCNATPSPSVTPTETQTSTPTEVPSLSDPICEPANDFVQDYGSYDMETGETTDPLACPEFEASCCPDSPPSPGADPLAGEWAADHYAGGVLGSCGGSIFPSVHKGTEPLTCSGSTEGSLKVGDDLMGCLGLYATSDVSTYAPYINQICERFDFAVSALAREGGVYNIRLKDSERTLDLNCTIEEDELNCIDEDGIDWTFRRS